MLDIKSNRTKYLNILRSGKYKKGTIHSDEKGYPIIKTPEDDNGHCACAIMIHEFPDENGKENYFHARKALGLTGKDCQIIQREFNDTPLTFSEIADKIEKEIFKTK